MSQSDQHVSLFKEKANNVSVVTVNVPSIKEAIDYAVTVCEKKEFHQVLILPSGHESSATEEVPRATVKTIAAPDLSDELFAYLSSKAEPKGIEVIRNNVRAHMAGIDVTIATANFGIADTGTSVMSTEDENTHLACMVCEAVILLIPTSKVYPDSDSCAEELNEMISKEAAYTSFITGSSRTSDIERVLTLGVHGPLEMHVALLEA